MRFRKSDLTGRLNTKYARKTRPDSLARYESTFGLHTTIVIVHTCSETAFYKSGLGGEIMLASHTVRVSGYFGVTPSDVKRNPWALGI